MRLSKSLFLLLAATLAAGVLASCGDDSPTGPEGNKPPAIVSPQIIESVDLNSDDPTALAAQSLVNGLLAAAKAPALAFTAVLDPTASADWGGDGRCWTWTHEYGTCTTIYKACPTENGFEWTVVVGGECNDHQYDDWVALRGESNEDGLSGVVRLYEANSTAVHLSMVWTRLSPNLEILTWSFYEGDVAEENLIGTLIWAGGLRPETRIWEDALTWEIVGEIKWDLISERGGEAGSMDIYDWNEGWVLHHEIVWNADGTGSWITYQNGEVWDTRSW